MRARRRLRAERPASLWPSRLLALLAAAVLVWYGLMVALLAAGLDPARVDSLSGLLTGFDRLSSLTATDVDGAARAIVAAAGAVMFLVFAFLVRRSLPRPYVARRSIDLSAAEGSTPGALSVGPRAIERAAERAARRGGGVSGAVARSAPGRVELDVELSEPSDLPAQLRDVEERYAADLDRLGLPKLPLDITLVAVKGRHAR
ncbi:hypothetical protein HJD18_01960 [Thermoleophilia bacterium SCSIO 60948]|nr:hypothetical protein HJD18_01960 [Thermoleophilia bacterium SCSIO 60948]